MNLTPERKVDRRALAKDLAAAEGDRAYLAGRVGELADALDACIATLYDMVEDLNKPVDGGFDCPLHAAAARETLFDIGALPQDYDPTFHDYGSPQIEVDS